MQSLCSGKLVFYIEVLIVFHLYFVEHHDNRNASITNITKRKHNLDFKNKNKRTGFINLQHTNPMLHIKHSFGLYIHLLSF